MELAQAASRRLAEATQDRLVALWALVETGELTLARFRALGASLIASANQAGVQLADIALAAEVTRQVGRTTGPVGMRPTAVQVDPDRIVADIDRILEDRPDIADTPEALAESRRARLARLGRSEPLLTVAASVQAGLVAHGANGWVRMTDPDPCKVCQGWADGVVRPAGTRMARHHGCSCIQQPVFT